MADGDRVFILARGDTGVRSWEIAPCLEHHDPHDCDSYTEAYETLADAEADAYEGTGTIFWGVYAHMREAVHSDAITPAMHLRDFDTPEAAMEFATAMNGKDGVFYAAQEDE